MDRRTLLVRGLAATVVTGLSEVPLRQAWGRPADYAAFLAGVRHEALGQGLPAGVVDQALSLCESPNAAVIKADRHQPEQVLTWAQYKDRVLTEAKLSDGLQAMTEHGEQISQIGGQYKVSRGVIAGIWGLESAYGTRMGKFSVIDALATLAYEGRRAAFFRGELLKALHILAQEGMEPRAMMGSYAGAMGQPQFMPSAYERFAVSYPEGGRPDIWRNQGDVFASIANYLARSGWQEGGIWGEAVIVPDSIPQALLGRSHVRPLSWWVRQGVRPRAGRFADTSADSAAMGAIIRPDGQGGEAFVVYHNFNVIRRYNASDFYALAVGTLGDAIT